MGGCAEDAVCPTHFRGLGHRGGLQVSWPHGERGQRCWTAGSSGPFCRPSPGSCGSWARLALSSGGSCPQGGAVTRTEVSGGGKVGRRGQGGDIRRGTSSLPARPPRARAHLSRAGGGTGALAQRADTQRRTAGQDPPSQDHQQGRRQCPLKSNPGGVEGQKSWGGPALRPHERRRHPSPADWTQRTKSPQGCRPGRHFLSGDTPLSAVGVPPARSVPNTGNPSWPEPQRRQVGEARGARGPPTPPRKQVTEEMNAGNPHSGAAWRGHWRAPRHILWSPGASKAGVESPRGGSRILPQAPWFTAGEAPGAADWLDTGRAASRGHPPAPGRMSRLLSRLGLWPPVGGTGR